MGLLVLKSLAASSGALPATVHHGTQLNLAWLMTRTGKQEQGVRVEAAMKMGMQARVHPGTQLTLTWLV